MTKASNDVKPLEQVKQKETKTTRKSDTAVKSKPRVPKAAAEPVPAPPGQDQPTVSLQAKADLYLYDQGSQLFMTQEKGVEAKVLEAGRFLCK